MYTVALFLMGEGNAAIQSGGGAACSEGEGQFDDGSAGSNHSR